MATHLLGILKADAFRGGNSHKLKGYYFPGLCRRNANPMTELFCCPYGWEIREWGGRTAFTVIVKRKVRRIFSSTLSLLVLFAEQ